MKLYVGGLAYAVTNEGLAEMFTPFGEVVSASVIEDKMSGQSRGFGFVEMSDEDANKAIAELNGKVVDGRALTVNESKPREARPAGSSYGGGNRGGGAGGAGGYRGGNGGGSSYGGGNGGGGYQGGNGGGNRGGNGGGGYSGGGY